MTKRAGGLRIPRTGLAWSLLALAAAPSEASLRFKSITVHEGGRTNAFVTIEVVNVGTASAVFRVQYSFVHASGFGGELQGADIPPGALGSLTIPSEKLRPGRNELVLRLKTKDDRDSDNVTKTYKKAAAGGLPDLKVVDARRARPGTYTFKVKNLGRAASPPYRVSYEPSNGQQGDTFATPDPAPSLPPGQAFEFVLENVREETHRPWFQVRIQVDPDQVVVEEREDNNLTMTGFGKQPFGGFF